MVQPATRAEVDVAAAHADTEERRRSQRDTDATMSQRDHAPTVPRRRVAAPIAGHADRRARRSPGTRGCPPGGRGTLRVHGVLRRRPSTPDHERSGLVPTGVARRPAPPRRSGRDGTVAFQQPALAIRPDRRSATDRTDRRHQRAEHAAGVPGRRVLHPLSPLLPVLRQRDGRTSRWHPVRPAASGVASVPSARVHRHRHQGDEPTAGPRHPRRRQSGTGRRRTARDRGAARQGGVPAG